MFDIQYLGHAGWCIKNKDIKILCDPWLDPAGTFFSSWFQFPRIDKINVEEVVSDVDILYISHDHADHFDPWTLEKIDKEVQVCISKFRDVALKNRLKELGFSNIKQLEEDETYEYENLKIRILKEEDHLAKDSCIFIDDGKNTILNLNDCHISPERAELFNDIDLLMVQFSSALWWPCVYNYKFDRMLSLCEHKRESVLQRCASYTKWIKAKNVIPCAGPPIFLDDNMSFWNLTREHDFNPFPLMDYGVEYLKNKGHNSHLILPDGRITLDGENIKTSTNEEEARLIYGDVNKYIKEYLKEKQEISEVYLSQFKDGDKAVNLLKERVKSVIKTSKIYKNKLNYPLLFEIDDSKWLVNFSESEENCFKSYNDEEFRYRFKFDGSLLAYMLQQKTIDFDYYFLSLRFSTSRDPDEYDDILFSLFRNFDDRRLRIAEKLYSERLLTKENFTLEHKGKKYKVQKYCPHMLADLESMGFVDENDNLVCPLHNWKFNLETGECKNSSKRMLCVKELK
mgnify:CR=1 FL=1